MHGPAADNFSPYKLGNLLISAFGILTARTDIHNIMSAAQSATGTILWLKVVNPGKADGNLRKKLLILHIWTSGFNKLNTNNIQKHEIVSNLHPFGSDHSAKGPKCVLDEETSQLTMMDWQNNMTASTRPNGNKKRINPTMKDTCSIKLSQLLFLLKWEGLPLVIAFRFVGVALKTHTHTHTPVTTPQYLPQSLLWSII